MYLGTGESLGFLSSIIGYGVNRAAAWESCSVSRDEFEAENKVAIYPGKLNVWLVARRRGAGPTIEEFAKTFVTSWVDTSTLFSNFPDPDTRKLSNDPNKIQLAMAAYGKRLQNMSLSKLTYKVNLGNELDFYLVTFYPPTDAPAQIPWPVEGCVEDANWALSSALSDIDVVTGKRSTEVVNSGTADTPMTAADVERQRQASLDALTASRGLGGGMSLTTWLLIGGAGAAALWYAKGRLAHR